MGLGFVDTDCFHDLLVIIFNPDQTMMSSAHEQFSAGANAASRDMATFASKWRRCAVGVWFRITACQQL
jgi:hypothetical protein